MRLFKKKAPAGNSAEPQIKESSAKGGRSKKNELVKVLEESVWESVHEEFKANKQFIIEDEQGNTCYVAFLFDTRQCGGLAGKEARKDESKGSIIEAIKIGSIKTYLRVEMLMDEVFIIIPDIETVDAMDEFGILADGDYVLCTVSEDGTDIKTITDSEDNEITVPFDTIRSLIQNGTDVHSIFPGAGDMTDSILGMSPSRSKQTTSEDEFDDEFDDELGDEELEILPDDEDELPADDDLEDAYDAPVVPQPVATEAPTSAPTAAPAAPVANMQAEDDAYDSEAINTDDEGGYDEFEDITEEVVEEYVARKFYSDDLGLEVSTEPFDMQFMHGNSYVPFNEDRGAGLLNENIANLAKDANVRMQRMHSENLFRMRERYMQLIQEHCANIVKAMDIHDTEQRYGKIFESIEHNKEINLTDMPTSVEKKKQQLTEAWNKKLDQVAQAAAAQARAQHIERFGRSHESDIQSLESREKDEIERDYQAAIRRLHADRKTEASEFLDLAVNATLKDMSELYLKVLHAEQREQARLQREITKFIDDNRKDEKARIETLAEERRQTNKAEEVRREYAAKIKAMSAEFDMKKTVLQADIDRLHQEHELERAKMEKEWAKKINEEKSRSAEVQNRLDELLDKYAEVDANKTVEYQKKLEDLESEKETWKRHTDDIIEAHKKSDSTNFKLSIVVIIAAMIAAIGIGFMCGSIINIRKTSEIEKSNIVSSYQVEQQVDEVDSDK